MKNHPASLPAPPHQAEDFWNAIDLMATEKGLSPSGLARAAGLDPTALNPSRRRTAAGDWRLPRLETLLHLLTAADLTFGDFARLTEEGLREPAPTRHIRRDTVLIRTIRFSALPKPDLFDRAGLPAGRLGAGGWDEISSPVRQTGPHDYTVRMDTARYEPMFRHGSLLVIAPAARIRTGDRVLIQAPIRSGEAVDGPPPFLAVVKDWSVPLRMVRPADGDEPVALSPDDPAVTVQRIIAATL